MWSGSELLTTDKNCNSLSPMEPMPISFKTFSIPQTFFGLSTLNKLSHYCVLYVGAFNILLPIFPSYWIDINDKYVCRFH